jgi:biotin carboxylase
MDQKTFLCVSCYYKGAAFLKAIKADGHKVFLVTSASLKGEKWPWESIDDIFYMEEDDEGLWKNADLISALAYLMRSNKIDRVIALDDFDVERAALIREEFRIAGMGQTTARYFRDKLAMRIQAREGGIPVPPFCALFNDKEIQAFAAEISAPWVVKPRSEASATGIKKVSSVEELWEVINQLGEKRYHYLVEQFLPGDVYHVDALSYQDQNIFLRSSRYLNTPFEVAHAGGIFRTMTLPETDSDHALLAQLNQKLMGTFGMRHGASHSEYIKSLETNTFYFLETSSRVGGAHIAEMIEAASGINLWAEWAHMETALLRNEAYHLPEPNHMLAAAIISLSRFQHPDDQVFNDKEIWWRINKQYHIGFILQSHDQDRLLNLLEDYGNLIARDFHAALEAPARSSH